MWHEAEEALAAGRDWRKAIDSYREALKQRYPSTDNEINKWALICKYQFAVYVEHWKNDPFERKRKRIVEEETFKVRYRLPTGRFVILRGKWDCVFQSGLRSLYLQENKTKGQIDDEGITRTVAYNLQTMFYLITLREAYNPETGILDTGLRRLRIGKGRKIAGTLYNVIRRPLGGRKYSIRQRKGETLKDFCRRAGEETVREDPGYFFKRWRVEIDEGMVWQFKQTVFHPILEGLCEWWDHITLCLRYNLNYFGGRLGLHYQFPWGVYNSLASGFRGDYFDLLTTGRKAGLERVENLFPELE